MQKKRCANYDVIIIQKFLHIYFLHVFFCIFIFVHLIKMTIYLNTQKSIAQIRVHKRRSIKNPEFYPGYTLKLVGKNSIEGARAPWSLILLLITVVRKKRETNQN